MDNKENGLVYRIFCTANGKSYVGQTWRTLETRWQEHLCSRNCVKLHKALMKYGQNRFVVSTLTDGLKNQADMDAAEIYWIRYFNCIDDGYNIRDGGGKGRTTSEETRARISKALKGIKKGPLSKETREKMSKARQGCVLSEETKKKIGRASKERGISKEARKKISDVFKAKGIVPPSRLGSVVSEETKKKLRKRIVDQNGVVYEGVGVAADTLNINRSGISNVLNGRAKTYKGYTFKFIEEK